MRGDDRSVSRDSGKQTHRQTDTQSHRHTDMQIDRYIGRQTGRKVGTDRRAARAAKNRPIWRRLWAGGRETERQRGNERR